MSRRRSRAFTLIELLVAMVVITVLSAALLVALYGAQEEARDARTHAQIAKLNELIARQWETYSTRKVPIQYVPDITAFTPRERQLARLFALRDLMRMEMPDRISDLATAGTDIDWGNGRFTRLIPFNGPHRPQLFRAYQRRITPTWSTEWQGAECLYLMVATFRDENSSARDFFRDVEIGDRDRDGMYEVLDGWGNPITFVRWAPGFDSEVQFPDRTKQPDHLDPLKVDPAWNLEPNANLPQPWKDRANIAPPDRPPGFLLFPLIYSAGPDQLYGILNDNPAQPHVYTATPMPLDPYAKLAGGSYIGAWFLDPDTNERTDEDNITNHYIEIP